MVKCVESVYNCIVEGGERKLKRKFMSTVVVQSRKEWMKKTRGFKTLRVQSTKETRTLKVVLFESCTGKRYGEQWPVLGVLFSAHSAFEFTRVCGSYSRILSTGKKSTAKMRCS